MKTRCWALHQAAPGVCPHVGRQGIEKACALRLGRPGRGTVCPSDALQAGTQELGPREAILMTLNSALMGTQGSWAPTSGCQ